ncbi:MAG: STT3 domain-containing protein [Nanoarchaeota archaeon]
MDDQEIDLKAFFKNLFSAKYKDSKQMKAIKKALPAVLLVGLIVFSVYLRTMTAWLPVTEDWARSAINEQLKSEIGRNVDSQFPNLPPQNRDQVISEQIDQFIQTNEAQYENQIQQAAQYFRSRLQNENGQTYLVAIDPYHWFRLSRNLVETGQIGDEVRDGVQWDALKRAPYGETADEEGHIHLIAFVHNIRKFFNKDADLMTSSFYLPVILATLAIIPGFFIAKKFAGSLGGFLTGLIITVHPAFMSRTVGGFSDTDPYNVTLPLFIVWFLIEAFNSKELKRSLAFSGLAVASMVLFMLSWDGWWYMYVISIAAALIYLVWILYMYVFKNKKKLSNMFQDAFVRKNLTTMGVYVGGTLLFTALLRGVRYIHQIFIAYPLSYINIKEVGTKSIWPNVYTTVAELNAVNHTQIISNIGGKSLFILAMLGILLTLYVRKKEHLLKEWSYVGATLVYYMVILADPNATGDFLFIALLGLPIFGKMIFNALAYEKKDIDETMDIKSAALLTVWTMVTIFSSTRGIRFIMLLMPAFAIGVGIFAGRLARAGTRFASKNLHINEKVASVLVVGLLIVIFVFSPVSGSILANGYDTARNQVPSMNDAWYDALTAIKEDSEPGAENTIISSWWDFGHWFKAIAQRPVFFDGASQAYSALHWTGRSLLSGDEHLSASILRYMACGRDNVYDILVDDYGMEDLDAVNIIYDMIVLSREDAIVLLEERGIPQETIDAIMEYSHCTPPDIYYITSQDMVGKGGVWGHFGSWDFERAKMVNIINRAGEAASPQLLVERFNLSQERANRYYREIQTTEADQWISPWPGYMNMGSGCSRRSNGLYLCRASMQGDTMNVLFNATSYEARFMTAQDDQTVRPAAISYMDNESVFHIKEYDDAGVPYALSFIPTGSGYSMLLLDPMQADSLFTRLFFFNGEGVKYFDKFFDIRGLSGERILIWKVDWQEYLSETEGEGYVFIDDPATEDNAANETASV